MSGGVALPGAALRLYLAWLVAVLATLGSLYYSEVRHFVPCTLCWYQRILMYPLVVVLGVAAYHADPSGRRFALPLVMLGWGVALYHVLLERVPALAALPTCTVGVPCTVRWVELLGFATIPVQSLIAFSLLALLLMPTLPGARASGQGDPGHAT